MESRLARGGFFYGNRPIDRVVLLASLCCFDVIKSDSHYDKDICTWKMDIVFHRGI